MRTPEITDEQWQQLKLLLPQGSQTRGRPRVDDRLALNGILYVLRTGSRWEDIPREYGSAGTCWRRWRAWKANGTWERIWLLLLSLLDERAKQDWTNAFLGGHFVPAKKGMLSSSKIRKPRRSKP